MYTGAHQYSYPCPRRLDGFNSATTRDRTGANLLFVLTLIVCLWLVVRLVVESQECKNPQRTFITLLCKYLQLCKSLTTGILNICTLTLVDV